MEAFFSAIAAAIASLFTRSTKIYIGEGSNVVFVRQGEANKHLPYHVEDEFFIDGERRYLSDYSHDRRVAKTQPTRFPSFGEFFSSKGFLRFGLMTVIIALILFLGAIFLSSVENQNSVEQPVRKVVTVVPPPPAID